MAHGRKRQHQFTRFGNGHPGLVEDAAHALAFDDELLPVFVDAPAGVVAGEGPGQDRIEPVHREARLGHVEQRAFVP